MLKIMKASAGSGKTTSLANEYIDMLLRSSDPQEYRHILAVTFTNKATAEMKDKILEKLFERACDPADKDSKKAAEVLHAILHDYGNFAVSTIDSFFQRTLRAFAHETGHYSSSQVELSKDSIIDEAVDSILDTLDENNKQDGVLLDFITESVNQEVIAGKSMKVDDALKDMAKELKSEEFWQKSKGLNFDMTTEYTPEKLGKIKTLVLSRAKKYIGELADKAGEIVKTAASIGLEPENFKGGKKGWFHHFSKASEMKGLDLVKRTDTFINAVQDPDLWFTKTNAGYKEKAVAALGGLIDNYIDFFDNGICEFNTCILVKKSLDGLAIAQRLEDAFRKVSEDRNVVCLDESNRLLKDIIDGSDAPFVYEKTGTRISHYLLDEFQDTSTTQWTNFQPLLKEAVAKDSEEKNVSNLIVGDVKQSIYRWRESDWELLKSKVPQEFPNAVEQILDSNYRSAEEIIAFNNEFYRDVAAKLDQRCACTEISEIYADVKQKVGKDKHKNKGYVELRFCNDKEEELDRIVEVVKREINEHGARPCDIAILVRTNDKGSKVAARLVQEGIDVETEASFAIISSTSVRRLVSMLSYVNNPDDALNAYIAKTMDVTSFPTCYHDLTGLCDTLYLILKKDDKYSVDCSKETVFISAFMDQVRDYASANGNNLAGFLKYWEDKNDSKSKSKPCISSALSSNAVKILSIHKSKGLAFPYVIVPFAEDINLYSADKTVKWCGLDNVQGTALELLQNKLVRVKLSEDSKVSLFAGDYGKEYKYQAIDGINMMYVATTRATAGMTIITSSPSRYVEDSFWQLLHDYTGGSDIERGTLCEFSAPKDDGKNEKQSCEMEYEVFPLGGRLGIRPYAEDYFNTENHDYEALAAKTRGIVLHDILSRVIVPSDLPSAVRRSVDDGSLAADSYAEVLSLLENAVEAQSGFFPHDSSGKLPAGYKVYVERPIFCTDGSQIRPDRVIIGPDSSVTIVDYKFGGDSKGYTEQMQRYAGAFRDMGYTDVQTKLWFVFNNYLR